MVPLEEEEEDEEEAVYKQQQEEDVELSHAGRRRQVTIRRHMCVMFSEFTARPIFTANINSMRFCMNHLLLRRLQG